MGIQIWFSETWNLEGLWKDWKRKSERGLDLRWLTEWLIDQRPKSYYLIFLRSYFRWILGFLSFWSMDLHFLIAQFAFCFFLAAFCVFLFCYLSPTFFTMNLLYKICLVLIISMIFFFRNVGWWWWHKLNCWSECFEGAIWGCDLKVGNLENDELGHIFFFFFSDLSSFGF